MAISINCTFRPAPAAEAGAQPVSMVCVCKVNCSCWPGSVAAIGAALALLQLPVPDCDGDEVCTGVEDQTSGACDHDVSSEAPTTCTAL